SSGSERQQHTTRRRTVSHSRSGTRHTTEQQQQQDQTDGAVCISRAPVQRQSSSIRSGKTKQKSQKSDKINCRSRRHDNSWIDTRTKERESVIEPNPMTTRRMMSN
uniref:Uncharacterized protein n=1 Tax=Anopheles albimanus TaxID=7167 RepID=A0A182FJQ3_ANOAL